VSAMSLTWKCHICGDERPDSKISVFHKHGTLAGGFPYQQNIRYCNDRPVCRDAAPQFDFIKPDTSGAAV
jgi:hypothetical protein